ncbi:tetratricopeptide repeat protein [Leucobacter sp. OH1287]|uniref:tetratricopeptide repeat protein n=1 Tax=Leucobacter sp. OH1287 TaxID=2491049 RepID=UPI000F5DC5EF|nr:tetratricopeptide repeat protein [Leucobacter sp. OH1287]RRD60704.1 hypothetical protein EII30_05490 [Leucobacter sp. OH1287]
MLDPSWHIDEQTLLPVIDDIAAFRDEFAADPLAEELVLLWTGHPEETLERLTDFLRHNPGNARARALSADALRDLGRFAQATEIYRELIEGVSSPLREATFRQHLGKVHFAAGEYEAAEECFAAALELRIAGDASTDLVASAELALARVRELLAS